MFTLKTKVEVGSPITKWLIQNLFKSVFSKLKTLKEKKFLFHVILFNWQAFNKGKKIKPNIHKHVAG